jgi:hypothetical protein
MFRTKDFDTGTQEFVQFTVRMPKSWDEGTVTFEAVWSHPSTTTNFGVAWGLAGYGYTDTATGDAAFGTAVAVTDTGGTTNAVYKTAESTAVTIASAAEGDLVQFQVNRTVADAGDTMAVDARLHGITIFYTTNAATDA